MSGAREAFALEAEQIQQLYAEANHARREVIRWWLRRNHFALHYVLRHAPVTGGPRFTYFAIALRLWFAYMVTPPLTVKAIARVTGFGDDATYQHIQMLEELGQLACHPAGWGRTQYEFLALGGSLGLRVGEEEIRKARHPQPSAEGSDFFGSCEGDNRKNRKPGAKKSETFGSFVDRENRDRARARGRGSSPPSIFNWNDGDPAGPEKLALAEKLLDFIEWYHEAYPRFHQVNGEPVKARLDPGSPEAHAILWLLQTYTLDKLQGMTVVMWTLPPIPGDRDAEYITRPTNNQSLLVLKEKAAYLHRKWLEQRAANSAARFAPYALTKVERDAPDHGVARVRVALAHVEQLERTTPAKARFVSLQQAYHAAVEAVVRKELAVSVTVGYDYHPRPRSDGDRGDGSVSATYCATDPTS